MSIGNHSTFLPQSALAAALALGLLALAPSAPALAQEAAEAGELPAAFTSDRPGFANTTGIAARGRLTTELGVSASFADAASTGSLPNLSMRVGVFDFLELRVRGPGGVGVFDATGPRFGIDDPSLGFKIGGRLADTLTVSSVWEVSVPLGTDPDFGSPEATFFADLNVDWNFYGPLTLTPNLVGSVLAVDDGAGGTVRIFEGGGSLKFTWQVIDVLSLYVQSYMLKDEQSDWRVQVGGGLGWLVAPNVQVDASFDAGVTEQGDAPTAGIGTTILW